MRRIHVRPLEPGDDDFLREMFVETFFWRDGPQHSLEDVLAIPEAGKYILGWGRPGDAGVVALSDAGEKLGAAWYRLFSTADHGYGFVSHEIPELGIAVMPSYRGRRVGRRVMEDLITLAQGQGRPGLSLSVEDGNSRAARLYESLGFQRVERIGSAWTMVLQLKA